MQEYLALFGDEEAAVEFLRRTRWPDGICCPRCGVVGHYSVKSRPLRTQPACRRYHCLDCSYQFSDLSGTPLHDSSTPVRKWLLAAYLLSQGKGISARRLSRELGVTYKTAWRMAHKLRGSLFFSLGPTLGSNAPVETDDTYIGGKRKGPRGRGARGKTAVLGLVERGGQVYCQVVPTVSRAHIVAHLERHVLPGAALYSDALWAYRRLPAVYKHLAVDHETQFVRADGVHTNTIEGFWSLLKRGLNGIYHWVSRRWLWAYLAEYCFRYNHRRERQAFPAFMRAVLRPTPVQMG
jgi:transposase-like protein